MKHYRKKTTGEVYGFELDGSQDFLITEEFVAMSDYELARHIGNNSQAVKAASLSIVDKVKGWFSA